MIRIEFTYNNHRGDDHVYVVDVESFHVGISDRDRDQSCISGFVVTRDGDERPELIEHPGGRRRTFILAKIRDVRMLTAPMRPGVTVERDTDAIAAARLDDIRDAGMSR